MQTFSISSAGFVYFAHLLSSINQDKEIGKGRHEKPTRDGHIGHLKGHSSSLLYIHTHCTESTQF